MRARNNKQETSGRECTRVRQREFDRLLDRLALEHRAWGYRQAEKDEDSWLFGQNCTIQ